MNCELVINTFNCIDHVTWMEFLAILLPITLVTFIVYVAHKINRL